MKSQRTVILASIVIVILLAVITLFFFWIEEAVPQNNIDEIDTPAEEVFEKPENQLYLTVMTHMERPFMDDQNESIFLQHVEELRYAMELADEVGAILSIESEQSFALANEIWDLNIMNEIFENGHSVQTHCDLGSSYIRTELTPTEFSVGFKENKTLVDNLIGVENNLGCSGGPGVNDWALGASIAGFKYLNGIVGGHLLAMPYENRPGTIWTDEYLESDGWHAELPEDPYERIYPIPFANARDFEADENPVIIAMPGTIGALYFAFEDDGVGELDPCKKNGNCEFTIEDIDATIEKILDISDHYDPERGVAKITIYIQSALYIEENEAVLKYFFSEIGKLEDRGIFNFGTHKEIYEAYIEQTGFDL